MATLQDVMDLARQPMNDAKDAGGSDAQCRTSDATLLKYTIQALLHAFRMRGDLFVGSYLNPPSLAWTKTQTFPLADEYIEPISDYVTARVESNDDEFVSNSRAAAFYALFASTVPA